MSELSSLAKSRAASARPASEPQRDDAPKTGKVAGAERVREGFSYLERSTARRETGPAGASGKAGRGLSRTAFPAAPRVEARQDRTGTTESPGIVRSKLKPRKLYDQKAASIARTVSDREKKAAAKSGRKFSDNAKLAMAFVLLVGLGTGLFFSVPEVTRVSKVSVNGMTNTSEKEIIEALLLNPDINLVNADLPAMESRILANPKVAAVNIGRSFPDKLVVDLMERKAVACVLVTEEIGTKSIAIDAEGVAFAYMESIAATGKLPVLSGIRFERFAPGQRLPEYLRPLLRDITELSKESPSPLEAFSEIKIERISDSEAEILLFPSGRSVPIRMPARLTRASLGSALLVLDILAGRQGTEKIEEIDFRTGTIVYRTKEAQPG